MEMRNLLKTRRKNLAATRTEDVGSHARGPRKEIDLAPGMKEDEEAGKKKIEILPKEISRSKRMFMPMMEDQRTQFHCPSMKRIS